MHSQPSPQRQTSTTRRTASLSNHDRSHSMRSYTYNPKASYQAGPSGPRSASLRASSYHAPLLSRAGAQSAVKRQSNHYDQPERNEDGSVVVTTRTTKVVDSFGRTTSITKETVRRLADGSNIIETKTTNISRPTSRNSSLSSSVRAGSFHGHQGAGYNLDKIDEDLQDFDYTYLDSPPQLNESLGVSRLDVQKLDMQRREYLPDIQREDEQYLQEQRNALLERNGSITSAGSPKRLRSILKNSQGKVWPEDMDDRTSDVHSDQYGAGKRHEVTSPNMRAGQLSNASGNSIKFRETVETISYSPEGHNTEVLQKEKLIKEEKEKQQNVDLYVRALQVATERVYGKADHKLETPPDSPIPDAHVASKQVGALAAKKIKKDHKREDVELGGVNRNYIYENHHRDFSLHSLRGKEQESSTTRKKRAKQEMKMRKEEEKREAELLKAAQKEKKKQEKASKKKKTLDLFGRSKRNSSVSDSFMSGQLITTGEPQKEDGLERQKNGEAQQEREIHSANNDLVEPQNNVVQAETNFTAEDQLNDGLDSHPSTSDHFVDVPEAIEEDEEERTRVRLSVMKEPSRGAPPEPETSKKETLRKIPPADLEIISEDSRIPQVHIGPAPETSEKDDAQGTIATTGQDVTTNDEDDIIAAHEETNAGSGIGSENIGTEAVTETLAEPSIIKHDVNIDAAAKPPVESLTSSTIEPISENEVPTLVSSANGIPQVITESSLHETKEDVFHSPKLEVSSGEIFNDAKYNDDVDNFVDVSQREQDSQAAKGTKESHREAAVIVPISDSSSDLATGKPQILHFGRDTEASPGLEEVNGMEPSQEEEERIPEKDIPVDVPSEAESFATVEPTPEVTPSNVNSTQNNEESVPAASTIVPSMPQQQETHLKNDNALPAPTTVETTAEEEPYLASNVVEQEAMPSPQVDRQSSEFPENTTGEVHVNRSGEFTESDIDVSMANSLGVEGKDKKKEKKQKVKKPSKFRKIIDKYFINNYSR